MNTKENEKPQAPGRFRPSLNFYHPNARGTGCALKLALHPAHDDVDGSFFLSIARQVSCGDTSGAAPVYPRFDWDGRICVKLDFNDLCKILQVLRGECESIDNGKGLFHRRGGASTVIRFSHAIEPESSYRLEISRNGGGAAGGTTMQFVFSNSEAIGLCEALAGSMAVVCFGIPMLVPRSDPRSAAKEKPEVPENGRAA